MESTLETLKTFNPIIALLILIAYIITDALYAKYTLDVANYNEYKAATIGSAIHFFLAFGIINYTENWLYIFPLAIGSWIGTFLMVRRERLHKTKT
ncbi:MAG: hypothetical protein V1867_04080 [Candidatus Falkowbacteria bacterium]